MGSIITAFKTGNLENVAKTFKEMSKAQQIAVLSSSALNAEQKQALATSAGLTITETGQIVATKELAGAQAGATATTSGFSAAMTGLGASIKATLISYAPFIALFAGLAVGAVALHNYITAFDKASEKAQESQSAYSSTTQELNSLKSEAESYKDTLESLADTYEIKITGNEDVSELIQKLQSSDLSLEDRAQVEQIKAQNSELERQITLKQQLAEQQAKQTEQDAIDALKIEHTQDMTQQYTTYDKTGMVENTQNRQTDIITASQNELEKLKQLKKDRQALFEDNKIDSKQTDDFEALDADIEKYTDSISSNIEQLNSLKLSFEDENGLMRSGLSQEAQDYYKQIVQIIDTFNNIDLTPAEQQLKAIESFFDDTTESNSIKEKLLEAVESGESATDALHAMGITLNDLGITGEDKKAVFDDYFSGLIESAKEAEEAINSVDGSVEGVKAALDSENQNADWSSMAEAANTVAELYKNGQVGTDDFKAFTQFMSKDIINPDADGIKYDADAYVEAYRAATDKIKRYFDSENPLQSVANFSNDLVNNGLATQVGDDLTWSFKSSAEAADKLGLSVDAVEVLMHNLEAYGAEFDEVMWSGEGLERYQSALEKIKTLYDSIEDEDSKERLKNILDQSELDDFESNLENLTEDKIIKIEFEYDLATIQQQIDELQKQVNTTGGTTEEWGSLNASKMSYRNKLASDSSMTGAIDDGGYKDSVSEFENLSQKLKTEYKELGEDGRREIQQQQSALLDFQNAYLDMFSSGEVASWEEFLGSDNLESVLEKISEDSGIAKEELENLFNIDLSSLDEPKHIKLEGEFDPGEIEAQLDELSAGSTITFNADVDGVESEVQVLKNEDGTLTYSANIEGVQTQLLPMLNQDGTVTYIKVGQEEASDSEAGVGYKKTSQEAPSDKTAGVWYKIKGVIGNISNFLTGGGGISGTAYSGGGSKLDKAVHGKAYLSGTLDDNSWLKDDWKTQKDNIALTGEVGQEIVVDPKTNTWRTVGDNGAEFTKIPKGSIVFDSKQTKDLLSKGHINSRGRAFASGTAYANGFRVPNTSSTNSSTSTTTASKSSSTKATQATQANTDATKENTEAQKETIDWIETLVDTQKSENERLSNAIENFEMHFNQNSAIDAYIKDSQAYMNTLRNAQNAYMSKANALGLDGTYVHKIWSGELSIEDIADEDLADKIKKYQDWYNQAKDLGDQLTEINTKIRESKINKLDNIKDDYDNLVDYAKSIADYNEAINDLYEARNLVGLEDPMMQVVNQQNAIRQALLNEEKELNDQLNALVADGTIAEYTDTWLKWKGEINGVSQEILECDKTLEELKETIREIRFNDFEKSLDALEFTSDMASSIRELMSEEGIYDDDAKITESGIAQLGLMGTELVSAKQKVANYNTAIEALAKDLENGNITQAQYNEQLQEYQKNQMDAIKSAKSAKDAILDLVKNGIEKETEAMDKLISKRKEDLSKQKEYYDFQKTMTDKSKEINKVRAQLASLEGDNSLEALSKRRKLESQLLELQDEYNENLRDREYDVVSDAYDKTLEDFKDNQDETLKELETNLDAQNKAIADALEIAKENYSGVYNQLQILADEYGFTLTDTIVKPWEDAISAIDQYQQSVGKLQGNISIDTSKIQGESPSGEQTIPTNNEASNQNLSKSANGTWIKQNGRWWYQHDDGSYTTNGWENIDGKWYKFDNKGWMQTGWQTDGKDENGNTKWYYLGYNGAMQSGWQKVNGKWYYLDSSGLMQTGWKNVNGMWYLLDQSGAMQTGWQKVDGKWYYLNSNGSMAVSQWIDDKYYVDHTGVMATNGYIKSKSGNQYYWVNDKGVYEPRWTTDHPDLEKYQLFYSSGAYRTKRGYGYVDDKDKKLYPGSELVLEGNGVMTDYGILRPLTGRETIFNEEQRKALWEMSLGKMPVGYEQTSPLDNMKVNFSKNDNQEVNIHYDNLIGNIEYVDKNALPDLQTILKKSFEYNVKELKKYSKR